MEQFFSEYKVIIVFLHVISAVIWVGGMVAMKYASHPSFMEIESPLKRLERIADALKRLFCIVAPFVLILLATAIIMVKGYSISDTEYKMFAYAKEGIWTIMFLNLAVMIRKRNNAQKAIERGELLLAKKQLGMIGKYMVPVNIALGVVAIFLGSYFSSVF